MIKLSILGSTGSIGVQTLEVVAAFPDAFEIVGLSAGRNISLFFKQIETFKPSLVCIQAESDLPKLKTFLSQINHKCDIIWGDAGLVTVATSAPDLLVVAIVGTASLFPTYKAIDAGIKIGLACKEVLVSAGTEIMAFARQKGVDILPIDSEHAAIHQCLRGYEPSDISKIILTASGGPFWDRDPTTFNAIKKADALKHPNWEMGAKITIDSATLMNKGLEVIEAYHLFGVSIDQVEVTVHPQSIIHSFVEFVDGNLLAHMGLPDMRYPIQYVLTYPEKLKAPWPRASISDFPDLTFNYPDTNTFPLLKCAFDVVKEGAHKAAVMNAANEAAVQLFLSEQIDFLDIPKAIFNAIETTDTSNVHSIPDIVDLDQTVKRQVLSTYGVESFA